MADPTFGELSTLSFGSMSLLDSNAMSLAVATLDDLAFASIDDLANSVYGDSGTSPSVEPNLQPIFKPVLINSSGLNSLSVVNGQFIVVLDTGRIYVDVNNTRVALGLPNMWGSANSGKYLNIQSDGTIGMQALPVYSGSVTDNFPQYNGEVE